jgi:3-hydroxyisobutyrate dehydrogenase/putative dehydrogenase
MKKVGVIGIGNMGSGLAKNLIKNGFATSGHDIDPAKMQAFSEMGGQAANNAAEVGEFADAVFIMVMNGGQVRDVIFGEQGLLTTLKPGSAIILSATINPAEVREVGERLADSGLHLIDTPVSGGYPGAQGGTLTLMLSAEKEVLEEFRPVLEAVSGSIHHVGTEIGMGQTVKACLQSFIGSIFSGCFEATTMAAKAGIPGQVIYDVFTSSSAGSVITKTSLENIIDRNFEGGGSHIATMHKDLTISMDVARDLGVPLFTAAMAMQLFQAGITKYPEGDNWVVTRLGEEVVDAELHR